ncbi:hypothetical protein DBW_0274 [Desulfuromonas sp. DDH964]|uniref:F510_1955 family glycosylhydrolase n=1 Tax=Desulfuromonas sp. DDH964 TaxID=1823759 RepID=UPI00078D4D37|nr:glycosyl hydrolase [Desulfuromonas sp. DDH964]AMV70674.1 hypothetical protein DBW_0274 [Desulfuromonas sp. DDH964]
MKSPSETLLRLLAACAFLLAPAAGALAEVTLTHVHGLAYSADGKRLFVPSHHGFAIYEGGKWAKAPGPEHDYMGFTATRNRFYSSGHPAESSRLVDPFGLMRSDDGGKSWSRLGLEGESDFHQLAAGYGSNAVYVYNHAPNSRMPEAGIYFTLNDGDAWQRARAEGLRGEPAGIAVHPEDPNVVAVATKSGLYLSADSGASFRALASGPVYSVLFDLDGRHLWYGGYAEAPTLIRLDWRTEEQQSVTVPPLGRDAVAFIAQNPAGRSEYAIATFKRSVFLSRDGGKSWKEIAREGKGLDR